MTSQVYLNCLYCGAKLRISQSISEFVCQFCGTAQNVKRSGGIIALEYDSFNNILSPIRESINKDVVQSKINDLQEELLSLELELNEINKKYETRQRNTNIIAILIIILVGSYFLLTAVYTTSLIPMLLCALFEFVIIWIWRKKINKIDEKCFKNSNPLIEDGNKIKKSLINLENKLVD